MSFHYFKRSNIELICFDLFGVIISEGHLISNVLMPLLPPYTDKQHVKSLYNNYNLGKLSEDKFWQGIGQPNHTRLRHDFLDRFSLSAGYEQVIPVLQASYRLSILSNLPAEWADVLSKRFGLNLHFSPCVFSGHALCQKPAPEIYQKLIALSQTPADRIVFIDDRQENLKTADELGMQTIYFKRGDEPEVFQPDQTVQQLNQLLPIFTG